MEFIKTNLLKVRSAFPAFGKYYLVCIGVITFITMVIFGVLLPGILTMFVNSRRSKEMKLDPIYLMDVYILTFVIVVGMKIVCQPIMFFFLRSSVQGRDLTRVFKMNRAWQNATICHAIMEIVLASIIPQWLLFDVIFRLFHYYMIYLLFKYLMKMLRQENVILHRDGIAAWA